MRLTEIMKRKKGSLSFEIFPPKGEFNAVSIYELLKQIQVLAPDFVSVTSAAGGSSNKALTCTLAKMLKEEFDTNSVAHLTCANSTKTEVETQIEVLKEYGVENVLALRGDLVSGGDYKYATDLIPTLVKNDFCVGAACYPEGHIDNVGIEKDIEIMKLKEDLGVEYFFSQLFFDNAIFYKFKERLNKKGITKPVAAGIMPFYSKAQIQRMIFMCGASLPSEIIKLLYKYETDADSLKKAGTEYAMKQISELIESGIKDIHFYMMNQPQVASELVEFLKSKNLR